MKSTIAQCAPGQFNPGEVTDTPWYRNHNGKAFSRIELTIGEVQEINACGALYDKLSELFSRMIEGGEIVIK